MDSVDVATPIGLRDRALVAPMVYSFARIGAALAMKVEDVFVAQRRRWTRLRENGGNQSTLPPEPKADASLAAGASCGLPQAELHSSLSYRERPHICAPKAPDRGDLSRWIRSRISRPRRRQRQTSDACRAEARRLRRPRAGDVANHHEHKQYVDRDRRFARRSWRQRQFLSRRGDRRRNHDHRRAPAALRHDPWRAEQHRRPYGRRHRQGQTPQGARLRNGWDSVLVRICRQGRSLEIRVRQWRGARGAATTGSVLRRSVAVRAGRGTEASAVADTS